MLHPTFLGASERERVKLKSMVELMKNTNNKIISFFFLYFYCLLNKNVPMKFMSTIVKQYRKINTEISEKDLPFFPFLVT